MFKKYVAKVQNSVNTMNFMNKVKQCSSDESDDGYCCCKCDGESYKKDSNRNLFIENYGININGGGGGVTKMRCNSLPVPEHDKVVREVRKLSMNYNKNTRNYINRTRSFQQKHDDNNNNNNDDNNNNNNNNNNNINVNYHRQSPHSQQHHKNRQQQLLINRNCLFIETTKNSQNRNSNFHEQTSTAATTPKHVNINKHKMLLRGNSYGNNDDDDNDQHYQYYKEDDEKSLNCDIIEATVPTLKKINNNLRELFDFELVL